MGFTCSDIAEILLKLALNANQSMGFVLFNLLISFWCSILSTMFNLLTLFYQAFYARLLNYGF